MLFIPSSAFQNRSFNVTVSNVVRMSRWIKNEREKDFLVSGIKRNQNHFIRPWIGNMSERLCSCAAFSHTTSTTPFDLFCRWRCLFHSTWPWEESAQVCKMRSAKKPWCSEIHHTHLFTKSGSRNSGDLDTRLTELSSERKVRVRLALIKSFVWKPISASDKKKKDECQIKIMAR